MRLFLAPEQVPGDAAEERRWWIELDKFIQLVPARPAHRGLPTRRAVFGHQETRGQGSRPPAAAPAPGDDDDGGSYCQCGWPYTLLLPHGTTAGMGFRLLVLFTDAATDEVPRPGHCGSMSYCGAADRYPDTRDMGYPFSRKFEQPIERHLPRARERRRTETSSSAEPDRPHTTANSVVSTSAR